MKWPRNQAEFTKIRFTHLPAEAELRNQRKLTQRNTPPKTKTQFPTFANHTEPIPPDAGDALMKISATLLLLFSSLTLALRAESDFRLSPDGIEVSCAPHSLTNLTSYFLKANGIFPSPGATKRKASSKDTPAIAAHPTKPDALSGTTYGDEKGFALKVTNSIVKITLRSQLIASYHYRHAAIRRPFFANFKTPDGIQVTRNFPPRSGDPRDHWDMHPGLSLGFALVNDVNFWHNKEGSVVHEGLEKIEAKGGEALFTAANRYLDDTGLELAREVTTYTFSENSDGYLLSLDIRLTASKSLEFGIKEEMGLALRAATPITVKHGKCSILSAAGGIDEEGTWGKVDRWWDYFGPIGGRNAGVQLMSAPDNPAVWSHSRDYGVLVANPFPVDNKANRGKKVNLARGETLRLRFGVQVHDQGTRSIYDPAAAYKRYINTLPESN